MCDIRQGLLRTRRAVGFQPPVCLGREKTARDPFDGVAGRCASMEMAVAGYRFGIAGLGLGFHLGAAARAGHAEPAFSLGHGQDLPAVGALEEA